LLDASPESAASFSDRENFLNWWLHELPETSFSERENNCCSCGFPQFLEQRKHVVDADLGRDPKFLEERKPHAARTEGTRAGDLHSFSERENRNTEAIRWRQHLSFSDRENSRNIFTTTRSVNINVHPYSSS
jgi:hypothetical protein